MEIKQKEIAEIIDEAVDAWHHIADTHGLKHCNCFREEFARRLIDKGTFVGYHKLDKIQ
jgi:hypothetical protein